MLLGSIIFFIIGTALLLTLEKFVVQPLSSRLYLRAIGRHHSLFATDGGEAYWDGLSHRRKKLQLPFVDTASYTFWYVLVSVVVMGAAGFSLGFAFESYFLGISLSPRGWPGMIALIGASFLGMICRVAVDVILLQPY